MKIVLINAMVQGSTGKIMLQIASCARCHGIQATTFSTNCSGKYYKKLPLAPEGHKYYSTFVENFIHLGLGMVTGFQECFGFYSTWRLIRQIDRINPEIIHLHNLHSAYINIGMLFRYIKKKNIKVVWTFHDCWPFTGQCPHFTLAKCNKWKTGCFSCPQYKKYPKAYIDQTKYMWKIKKKLFTLPQKMVIVTPSEWLRGLVKESFLGKYPVKVVNNGIDLSVFRPTKSDFRKKYNLEKKHIVLGVSFSWGYEKGLDVFIELASKLNNNYQIILVGTTSDIDCLIPKNIISLHKTSNQNELAEIYSVADVFINPTREENYPTVNMEALACGTPVITFKTGGSSEMITNECGRVVNPNDVEGIIQNIIDICERRAIPTETCVLHAQDFDKTKKFEKYISIYKELREE